MMKKIKYLLVAVAVVCLVTACKNKAPQTREEQINEFRSMLTAEDTTQMLRLCDNAMELLKNKKVEEVVASLYEYNDSTKEIKPLSKELSKRYTNKYKMFPVLRYTRKYYSFQLEGCNDVKYEVVFATAEQAGTQEDPVTAFMFNPVKIDGEWKLCLKTLNDKIDIHKSYTSE